MKKWLKWLIIFLIAFFLVFIFAASSATIKKPAIYLYPVEDSNVQVKLNVNGKIVEDIPEYNNGWNVFVTKEGIIENQYDYLFYEAKLKNLDLPQEGWVVKYEDLKDFFDETLSSLNFNEKEISQFEEYWLTELPRSNYYEIKLLSEDFLKENMDLLITPEPDTVIRVNFYFRPLDRQHPIENPVISSKEREGFTVVEWGGILAD